MRDHRGHGPLATMSEGHPDVGVAPAIADALREFEGARAAWVQLRDSGTRHLAALSNAKQEATYVKAAAQDEFAGPPARTFATADSPIERAGRRALENCKAVEKREYEKLCGIIREMSGLVDKMSGGHRALRACWNTLRDERLRSSVEQDEYDKQTIGGTWTAEDFVHRLAAIVDSFQTELFMKASIVEDAMHQSDPDVMLSYSAAFLSEPYLSGDIETTLEAAKYDLQLQSPNDRDSLRNK